MESTSSKAVQDAQKQAEIRRQIALLQTQLAVLPEAPASPPRAKASAKEPSVLAPATPSPKKKAERREQLQSPTNRFRKAQQRQPPAPLTKKSITLEHTRTVTDSQRAAPSSLISQLRSLNPNVNETSESVSRSEGFAEKPAAPPKDAMKAPVRDERLAIVEDLELGPAEHKPIADDPDFEKVEPNSGIRMKSRELSHEALQAYLSGRYFLPPSLLYSVVRLMQNKQAYEVPVEGDWVTIAVVAERGEVKFTSGPGNSTLNKREEDIIDGNKDKGKSKPEKNSYTKRKRAEDDEDEENPRKGGKKYVHLKLVDFGHRSRSTSSATQRAALRGDAQLSLLLFESDYPDKLVEKDATGKEKVRKLWRGGSGGAFEECFTRLREGTVIALLNPKVLKPFQNTKNPSSSSILALTPPSASAIAIIGHSRDLGMCNVRRRDGKPCGAWVDKRVNTASSSAIKGGGEDVCEYHIQSAVQRARAGRAEFSIGTSGMSTTANKRKAAYDPSRQWGLKPEAGTRGPDGETTYVLAGYIASSSSRAQAPGVAGETIGREGQARAKRRKDERDEDKALSALLGKGSAGGTSAAGAGGSKEALEVLRRAREVALKTKEKIIKTGKGNSKEKESAKKKRARSDEEESDDNTKGEKKRVDPPEQQNNKPKKKYSAEMVKKLGFDPTLKVYGPSAEDKAKSKDAKSKLLKSLANQKREVHLGPPPGKKLRSGVSAPATEEDDGSESNAPKFRYPSGSEDADLIDLGIGSERGVNRKLVSAITGSLSGCEVEAAKTISTTSGVSSDSDSDLEIEPPIQNKEDDELEYI